MMLFVGLAPMIASVTLGLAESLKAPDPEALRPRRLFANWRRFFATRACIANAGIQAGAFGALYAYISGSAFVLIQGFGVSPFVYSALFASRALHSG